MVDKLIAWIVRLFERHGYVILSEEEHGRLSTKPDYASYSMLTERIQALEKNSEKPQQRKSNDYTAAEILSEWLNGEVNAK